MKKFTYGFLVGLVANLVFWYCMIG